jgi:trigger factor
MSVVLSIEDVGPCRKQLRVEVPAPAVDAETRRVVDEFRRRAKLPGFRKGRVPAELVQQRFREEIEREVVDRLLPRYWRQAEAESELDPLLPPSVEEVELKPGEPLTFIASVETRPEIELGDIRQFDLPEAEIEPAEEELEGSLSDLQRKLADWVLVERPATQGDLVVGHLVEIGDEAGSEEGEEGEEVAFEVGDANVWEELSLEATGKSAGQEARFERREGEGDALRRRRFRLSITAVKERDLPPLDDELAARVGKFDSLIDLREDLRKRLRLAKEQERRHQRERALADQLRERHPLGLPAGVVDHEIELMLRDYAENLAAQGVDLESGSIEWPRLAEQIRPQAERRVHVRLLLDAVANELSIEVGETDFEKALAGLARAQGKSTASVRRALDQAGKLKEFRLQLRRDKTLRRLLNEEDEGASESVSEGLASDRDAADG